MSTSDEMAAIAAEMEQASTADSSSDSPTPETPVAEAEATPAAQATPETAEAPAASTEPQEEPEPTGPLPLERHKAILERTRREYDAKLEKLRWAESADPKQFEKANAIAEWIDNDPQGFYQYFDAQLRAAGMLNANERAAAAAAVADKHAQAQPAVDARPEPDIIYPDGTLGYSAKRQEELLDWKERELERKFEAKYGKVAQAYEASEADNRLTNTANGMLADARTWEGFRENEVEIAQHMAKDGRATLASAYRAVVIPKLKADEKALREKIRKDLLVELGQRARTSTIQPTAPGAGDTSDTRGMSTAEIMRAEAARLGL